MRGDPETSCFGSETTEWEVVRHERRLRGWLLSTTYCVEDGVWHWWVYGADWTETQGSAATCAGAQLAAVRNTPARSLGNGRVRRFHQTPPIQHSIPIRRV